MKSAWRKKELWLLIGISLLVGSLIHFPELLSLIDAWGNKRMFQHLSPVEVLVEIAYAAGSFWLLFLINLRLPFQRSDYSDALVDLGTLFLRDLVAQ